MDQAGGGLRFVVESFDVAFVLGQLAFQHLHGHLAAQRALFGEIDLGHGAAGQATEQPEVVELTTREVDIGGRLAKFGGDVRHDFYARWALAVCGVAAPISAVHLCRMPSWNGTSPRSKSTVETAEADRLPAHGIRQEFGPLPLASKAVS